MFIQRLLYSFIEERKGDVNMKDKQDIVEIIMNENDPSTVSIYRINALLQYLFDNGTIEKEKFNEILHEQSDELQKSGYTFDSNERIIKNTKDAMIK